MKLLYKYNNIFIVIFKGVNLITDDFIKLTKSLRPFQQQRMYIPQLF